jgi:hypothetical protein
MSTAKSIRAVKRVRERRRHSRFPLGLPVRLQLAGREEPITVEMMDISEGGGRFRTVGDEVRVDQRAVVGFVVPDQRRCVANGRVVRVERDGQFIMSLDHANDAFRGFLGSLSGP